MGSFKKIIVLHSSSTMNKKSFYIASLLNHKGQVKDTSRVPLSVRMQEIRKQEPSSSTNNTSSVNKKRIILVMTGVPVAFAFFAVILTSIPFSNTLKSQLNFQKMKLSLQLESQYLYLVEFLIWGLTPPIPYLHTET